jgi:DNA damage-binding protein 1
MRFKNYTFEQFLLVKVSHLMRHILIEKCIAVMRVAYQAETGTIGILVQRWDTFSNGERITGRPSVSTLGPRSNIAGEGAETVGGRRHNEPDPGAGGCDQEVYSFCLLDANTFECLSVSNILFTLSFLIFKFSIQVHELGKFETMQSLASLKLGNDPTPYFAIGTATVHDDEDESKQVP